jgi:hypothetical protein
LALIEPEDCDLDPGLRPLDPVDQGRDPVAGLYK